MRDFSSIAARFEGAFSDYEIHLSTQMSGYFIITKRGGYSSELIGEEVGELVFKDCTKTSDEIRDLIASSQKNSDNEQNKQVEPQPKDDVKQADFAVEKPSLGFEIIVDEPKTSKKNIDFIIDDTPSTPAFSIECTDDESEQESKPAFEILDDEENIDENNELASISDENSRIPFEIEDANVDESAYENSQPANLSDENSRIPFEIEDENINEGSDESINESDKSQASQSVDDENKNDELSIADESVANPQIITHHDSQKIFFAKNTEIISAKVVEVELVISGYDESCDSFSFEKIPPDCEYKYSIKIGELRAIFIATMSGDEASEFISGFSFKTERQVPKNIEIFINESAEPVLSTTLFA